MYSKIYFLIENLNNNKKIIKIFETKIVKKNNNEDNKIKNNNGIKIVKIIITTMIQTGHVYFWIS